MPKVIELTIEIEVQKVSCPGVWLCQDGRVSLTVSALGTSYQTCLLPPVFPLEFKDVFYFRKQFQDSCALNNICCLLENETIYCELVQWCGKGCSDSVTQAQYLGAMNDVIFPPNLCSSDGVDLLMRRSKNFPGILSPKIEIATKVRLDELLNQHDKKFSTTKFKKCYCSQPNDEGPRQKPVCHSAQYHRNKCSKSRSSRSRSRSYPESLPCFCADKDIATEASSCGTNPVSKSRGSPSPCAVRHVQPCRQYDVYTINTATSQTWRGASFDDDTRISETEINLPNEERPSKLLLESRYIDQETNTKMSPVRNYVTKLTPCVCEICNRYHEIFHTN